MTAVVIPFPSERRLAFVRRHAKIMSTLEPISAERHLRRQVAIQIDAMARRGINRALVEKERVGLEEAIRSALERLSQVGAA